MCEKQWQDDRGGFECWTIARQRHVVIVHVRVPGQAVYGWLYGDGTAPPPNVEVFFLSHFDGRSFPKGNDLRRPLVTLVWGKANAHVW